MKGDERTTDLSDNEKRELVIRLVGFCLQVLVEQAFVTRKQLAGRVRFDFQADTQLDRRDFAAATTQDDAGNAVLQVHSNLPIAQTVWCLPHEAVHIAQVCRGDLAYPLGGGVIWKGERWLPSQADDPQYFGQPWEEETGRLAPELMRAMKNSYPALQDLIPAGT